MLLWNTRKNYRWKMYNFYEDNKDKDFHDLDKLNAYDTAIAKYVWILSWTKTGKMVDHYHASAVERGAKIFSNPINYKTWGSFPVAREKREFLQIEF